LATTAEIRSTEVRDRLSPPSDLKPNTLEDFRWDAAERSEVIRILDLPHYELDCRAAFEDMEFTIVHELLHLKISLLPRCEADRKAEEDAVNDIARTLLMIDKRAVERDVSKTGRLRIQSL